jgi:phenylalanyl-tRNA synthetase beta chain
MKISLNWLKDFIELDESPEIIGDVLTQTGLEVEGLEKVEKIPGGLDGLVVGEVLTCDQHPDADKLKVTTVDFGQGTTQIVCGAPNVAQGQKVVVAPINTVLHPSSGEPFKIKKAKIRGQVSEGMICAEDEIGLGNDHDGIIVLDTLKPNGTPITDLYDNGEDYVFEIGLTPNRGDATSHLGAARDLKAYYGRELNPLKTEETSLKEDHPIKVTVENHQACPRYAGVTLRGLKVAPSPDWLQFRLRAIGQEPINNIVDITNYIMHHLGQPLHAFDAEAIVGNHVIVKNLEGNSPFVTLDEKERKLHEDDLMICNESEGMCIAGVFGGSKSGVKETTTSIFLESAYFSSDSVRNTTLRHGLSTDAAFRFERGIDPNITLEALKYATQMILDLCGGYRASEYIDCYPEMIKPIEIKSKFDTYHRLIGIQLPQETIIGILKRLDIDISDITETSFLARVPPYRSEVTREADLVEEVLRIYGINNIDIDESFSTGYLAEFDEIEPYKLQETLSMALTGKGFQEIITNSITNATYDEKLGLSENDVVRLLNPSSEDLNILRPTMLYTGLESIRHNINRKQTYLKFYEFGSTYHKKDKYKERRHLQMYLTGKTHSESWLDQATDTSVFHLIEVVELSMKFAGITSLDIKPLAGHSVYDYGLALSFQNKALGIVGKVKRNILDYFEIGQDVFVADIDWDAVLKKATKNFTYQPISKYPEVRRDLSLVIDRSVSYQDIEQLSKRTEKKLLKRMNVFSIYEGDKIDEGKKAYAIAFYLQDQEKTLNDKQIDKTMTKLMSQFENELKAIIRR